MHEHSAYYDYFIYCINMNIYYMMRLLCNKYIVNSNYIHDYCEYVKKIDYNYLYGNSVLTTLCCEFNLI